MFDVSKTVNGETSDGKRYSRRTSQTFANITINEKRKHEGDLESGLRKHAKLVSNILDHTSMHDKDTKAKLVAKLIDKEGATFGRTVKEKSKVIQGTEKLTPEQTVNLITGTGGNVHQYRQIRTVFKNTVGYTPIASQRKVDEVRAKMMIAKKEDWSFEKKLLYKNKQGQNKAIPAETD